MAPSADVTSLKPWLNAVAAKTSTPGGGNVAAVLGAQATALICMVCQFSKDPGGNEALLHDLDQTRNDFLQLAEADSAAFKKLMLCYRVDKADPLRTDNLQKAITNAALIPLETYELAAKTAELLITIEPLSNPNLHSDTAMAGAIINATLTSARINVLVNLKAIHDKAVKSNIERRLENRVHLKASLSRLIDSLVQRIAD
ncbi:MAG: cyclodeaminase/cyclohydrolase family protein [Gammaproteobacteria bacterium]|jgi:methenyltetrahydrofolate cyclohydrolase|nr:cyclodeaminase/cyclohydrolase family protein [Gammaproteobacteria bacterium]MBT5205083.1 cyclodeaminase/cyclohydrolase family protein [Gammaproteobacteria bacterium]MBT5603955.1 cyclodeaminase/cyclohydrolase family protein [Gammaproteobacteria bacterium]MBT6244037.1 cyclodeaminase/cyclohydrolase family protein [Gammaproteobacteria bacterium]